MSDDRLIRIEADIAAIQSALDLMRLDIGIAERRSQGNAQRVVEAHERISHNSNRIHRLEDLFEPGGSFALLEQVVYQIAADIEQLKQARAAGDGS